MFGAIGQLQARGCLHQLARIEQVVEEGAEGCCQTLHIGFDRSLTHLKQQVAAELAVAGSVVAGGNIGAGELGELLHKTGTCATRAHVAAEEQDVCVGA